MANSVASLPDLVGENPSFLETIERCSRLACVDRPILVVGERGTGKELIAARLHYLSSRWAGPFIRVNCAALTETLLDSELFGHEGGAFTGAKGPYVGRFERADGGSLFLDEVATMSPRLQEKLLRAIEYGEFERVGGGRTRHTDVRVIGATNADLRQAVNQGQFRPDLLDRLAFDVVALPPLRNRANDVVLLAEYFATRAAREFGHDVFAGFAAGAHETLLHYAWPGNVRELRNVIERSVFHTPKNQPVEVLSVDPFAEVFIPIPTPLPSLPVELDQWLADMERKLLQLALDTEQGHQKRAADLLSLSYHQFRARMKTRGVTTIKRRLTRSTV